MPFTRLESFIYEKMAATKLAGVSAAVVHGEDVIWARGFGCRDAEHFLPATPQTLYCVASLTKSFTVSAVMQLAERGLLSLDDPLETYVPEFKLRPGGESVRLWHCMAHMSGIPALAFVEAMIDHATGNTDAYLPISGPADLLTFMDEAEDWVLSKPGESYHYLNEGYVMLGLVIERVSGQPFADYVTEHILRPLGMTRSTFAQATFEADPDAAVPYMQNDAGENLPSLYIYGPNLPDGGLISSVLEMARYVAMRLGNGSFEGVQILRPESVAEMQRQRTTTGWQDTDFGEPGYGLGLGMLPNFLGRRVIQHGGSVGTATSHLAFLPDEGLGVIVAANGSGYAMSKFAQYALAEALGEDPEALPFVRRERQIAALEGVYETYKGTTRYEVRAEGTSFLSLTERGRIKTNVSHAVLGSLSDTESVFILRDGPSSLPITFRRDGDRVDLIHERYLFRKVGKLP